MDTPNESKVVTRDAVATSRHTKPWILMCPPRYYGIEYEINPWMNRRRGADRDRAARQWQELYDTLVTLGAHVSLVDPEPGLPDMVFTANAGLVYRNRFVSSRFRPAVRRKESRYFEGWLQSAGFQLHRLPTGLFHEGAGDALFCGTTLFGGYRTRSDAVAHQYVATLIGCQTLPLELIDPRFYHLDTCFCPLASNVAIWYPPAFDGYAQQVIRNQIADLVEVTPTEALRFAANAVVIGHTVVVPEKCWKIRRELEARGFEVRHVQLDEFIKAGGSAKCLTLRLDGEEAAAWRTDPTCAATTSDVP